MIKAILADLDGTVIESKELHFLALNQALETFHIQPISKEEHIARFDGLSTHTKLDILYQERRIAAEDFTRVERIKQQVTRELIPQTIKYDERIYHLFESLYQKGYKLGIVTNTIPETAHTIINILRIGEFCNLVLTNGDTQNKKPHPEIYWKAISILKMLPSEVLIIEDNVRGVAAALESGAHCLTVKGPQDVTMKNINEFILNIKTKPKITWSDKKLNILIPAAGAGKRFKEMGYKEPKPLVPIPNMDYNPMLKVVVDSLGIDANYIFLVLQEHVEKYSLRTVLNLIAPGCKMIIVDKVTEGAAATTLLARDLIDNENELLIVNSDQYIEWNAGEFLYKMRNMDCDGGIVTFKSDNPKWSFAKTDGNGKVLEVAEKRVISDNATVGIYWYKEGREYVKYAERMIEKDIRHNNEFYVAPIFNQFIEDNKDIRIYSDIKRFFGMGTPSDLNEFVENY